MLGAYTSELGRNNLRSWFAEVQQRAGAIGRATDNGAEAVDPEELDWMVQNNRELRRIYDQTAMRHQASFDEQFAP